MRTINKDIIIYSFLENNKIMDDLASLFQARKTVIEMLQDRGFTINPELNCEKITNFKQIYNEKKCDILVKEPSPCYVKFVLLHKVRPNILRDYINQIREKTISESDELIIVIRNKPNSTLLKITKEFRNIQIFWLRNLMVNITRHSLNPKFRKLSEEEIEAILKTYHLNSRYLLPIMLSDDPISKYFGFKNGNVCEVTRTSKTNGNYICYRCVK